MDLAYPDPVLLVEDTPSLSMVYRSVLEKAGLAVNRRFKDSQTGEWREEPTFIATPPGVSPEEWRCPPSTR